MVQMSDIHPVTDFTRKTKEYIRRLKKTGNPEVLTVNGEAEVVVQSAGAYQKLVDAAELAKTLPILEKMLADSNRGEGKSARSVLEETADSRGAALANAYRAMSARDRKLALEWANLDDSWPSK